MSGENCTSGCLTRDHESTKACARCGMSSDSVNNCSSSCPTPGAHQSWGECVRSKNFKPMWLGGTGPSYGEQKRFENDTAMYRQVVRDGASMSTAMHEGVDVAYKKAGLA